MFIYLMASKLLYLHICNIWLITCVRTSQTCNQSFSNIHYINLKTSTILAKRLILVAWLGPERVSTDGKITVLKIQTEICKNGRWVKMESFKSIILISYWSLSHKPTFKTTIKSICPLLLLTIFFGKVTANYYQSICDRFYFW